MMLAAINSRPQLGVIIPVFRDDAALTRLLHRLENMNIAKLYIIDGEGRHMPPEGVASALLNFTAALWCPAPRGRGPQIAYGISRLIDDESCDSVWVLHADSTPETSAEKEIARVLSHKKTALGMFRLSFGIQHWAYHLFEIFARLDSALTSFGDQGFFFRSADVAVIWPRLKAELDASPILEDMVLRHALKTRGRVTKSSLKIGTSPRRFERYGLWQTQIRNMFILLRAYFGTPPAQLYKSYYDPASPALLVRDAAERPRNAPIIS